MPLKAGIIGLPNVGKSTLFNLLTGASAPASGYPFCTIEPNRGVAAVPDERLDRLAALVRPRKTTPAVIEFVDIAGLVEGAGEGEGLGNEFLSHVAGMDLLVHVVRTFAASDVAHVSGEPDPARDAEIVEKELAVRDLQILGRREAKLAREARGGAEEKKRELERVRDIVRMVREGKTPDTPEERRTWKRYGLVSGLEMMYVVNCSEEDFAAWDSGGDAALRARASRWNRPVVPVAVKFELEISQLPGDEQAAFREEYGIREGAVTRLVREVYAHLDLVTFFTVAGGKEVRATAVPAGTTVREAAGKIHSDMEESFIKAEVYNFADLEEYGSPQEVKAAGRVRVEGKEYPVQDGDIVLVKF